MCQERTRPVHDYAGERSASGYDRNRRFESAQQGQALGYAASEGDSPRPLTTKERIDHEIASASRHLERLHHARQLLEQNPLFEAHQETAKALEAAGIYVTR